MFNTILIVIAVLIVGVLVLALSKPDDFRIERKAGIKAPPEKVFGFINDFSRWGAWSPWEKKDPNMKRTFGATTSGKGATYAWDGNKDVGQGSMTITDAVSPSKLTLTLDFIKPFEAHNTVHFNLTSVAEGAEVSWSMEGRNNLMSKIIQVFMSMDKMVGPDFEAGLVNLKAAAEKP